MDIHKGCRKMVYLFYIFAIKGKNKFACILQESWMKLNMRKNENEEDEERKRQVFLSEIQKY